MPASLFVPIWGVQVHVSNVHVPALPEMPTQDVKDGPRMEKKAATETDGAAEKAVGKGTEGGASSATVTVNVSLSNAADAQTAGLVTVTLVRTPIVQAAFAPIGAFTWLPNETHNRPPTVPATQPLSQSIEVRVPPGNGSSNAVLRFELPHAALWSPESPALYTAVVQVVAHVGRQESPIGAGVPQASTAGEPLAFRSPIDALNVTFGIRSFVFDPRVGLLLNGRPIKLRGANVHPANGPLGGAAIRTAEERKVALLKASGYNAVRTAHNPTSSAFLDACDRFGLIVMAEFADAWDVCATPRRCACACDPPPSLTFRCPQDAKRPSDYHLAFPSWCAACERRTIQREQRGAYAVGGQRRLAMLVRMSGHLAIEPYSHRSARDASAWRMRSVPMPPTQVGARSDCYDPPRSPPAIHLHLVRGQRDCREIPATGYHARTGAHRARPCPRRRSRRAISASCSHLGGACTRGAST